jgi:phage terminase large subunit GpA-like protein
MAKKEKVGFNWHCPHCQYRNRVKFSHQWQIEMPQNYSAIWECNDCGKESQLEWNLSVNGWWERGKKAPKLRKRVRDEKKRKKRKKEVEAEHDNGETQKDSGYRNDSAKQKI